MAFKGTRNTNGRPKGSANKSTSEIREFYKMLVSDNMELLNDDLKSLEPFQRLKVVIELSKFVLPTLKSIDIKDNDTSGKRIIFVSVPAVEEFKTIPETYNGLRLPDIGNR